jgi:uncharacterized protein
VVNPKEEDYNEENLTQCGKFMVDKFVDSLIALIEKHTKACLLLSLGLFLLSAPGLMFYQAQNDVRIWFRPDDPNIMALNSFEHRFGNDENLAIAFHHPEGLFEPKRMKLLADFVEELWHIPQVIRVDALTNATITESLDDEILIDILLDPDVEWSDYYLTQRKEIALGHHQLPGYLISRDGQTALSFARLTPTLHESPNYERIINVTREIKSRYQGQEGVSIYLTGEATINNAFREISSQDSRLILPLLCLVIIICLGLMFHSLAGVLLPLGLTVITVASTLGMGFHFGLKFNSILNILPAILVAITIADSVHVLMSMFQFKAMGHSDREAVNLSLHKNIVPTLLTSLTTMIGFLSLTLTDLLPIQRLGFMAGLGCFLAWYFTIFLMGPILYLYPLKLPGHLKKAFCHLTADGDQQAQISKRLIHWIARFRKTILWGFSGLTIISLIVGATNEINANPWSYFAKGTEIWKSNNFVKTNFGGTSGPELLISSGAPDGIKDPEFLRKVEALKLWLDTLPFIDKSIDIVDIVKEMGQSFNGGDPAYFKIPDSKDEVAQLLFLYTLSLPQGMDLNNRMTLDQEAMRMTILWRIQTSKDWGHWVREIQNKAQELELDLIVTGKTDLFQRMMGYVVITFAKSILTASVLVCLLMILLFGSIKIGLISLLPNFLPLVIGAAFMKLTGMHLNVGTTIVASVCLGIAVDDTIHFLSNYYRWKKRGLNSIDALTQIMTFTGSALLVTTIILVAGFGLFIFGSFTPNVNFGVMCAFILTTALIVDLIFLPALLLDKKKA